MPAKRLLSPRAHADGHESPAVGLVGFEDGHERHPSSDERGADSHERFFVGSSERYREGSLGEIPRTTFPCRVDNLGSLHPFGEVGPNDDVVAEGISAVGRFTVVARSWWEDKDPLPSRQPFLELFLLHFAARFR